LVTFKYQKQSNQIDDAEVERREYAILDRDTGFVHGVRQSRRNFCQTTNVCGLSF
jgi:hypothetical protein